MNWQDVVEESRESVLAGPWNPSVGYVPHDWREIRHEWPCDVGCKLYMHYMTRDNLSNTWSPRLSESVKGWDLLAAEAGTTRIHVNLMMRNASKTQRPFGNEHWPVSREIAWNALSQMDIPKLTNANLWEMYLSFAQCAGIQAPGSSLRYAIMSWTNMERANLYGADLMEASMYGAKLFGANLDRSCMDNVFAQYIDLNNASLKQVRMRKANLKQADLQEADLTSAKLLCANLQYAQMQGALLCKAELLHAQMQGALLCKADLLGADLICTNLSGADLRSVRLDRRIHSATVTDAKVSEDILKWLSFDQRKRVIVCEGTV